MQLNNATNIYYGSSPVSAVYLGSALIWPTSHDYSLDYLTLTALGSGNVTLTCAGNGTNSSFSKTIEYSYDGSNWTTITAEYGASRSIPVSNNDKVYFKGLNNTYSYNASAAYYNYFCIRADVNHTISGNIMSMFYGDNFAGQTTFPSSSYNLFHFFTNNTYLTDASNLVLPVTTLTNGCYYGMFMGCTSLTTTPEIPATTLTEKCYMAMFHGCTSLTTAPYLPAIILVNRCYEQMFDGCTSLNYVKAAFTTEPTLSYTNNWLFNVSATGTFVKSQLATWTNTGEDAVPVGWTIETF